jgi:hypothetical protein
VDYFAFLAFVLTLSIFLLFDCLLAVAVLRAQVGGSEWVFGMAKIVSYFLLFFYLLPVAVLRAQGRGNGEIEKRLS